MKRILAALCLMFVFSLSIASAQIKITKDSFDGKTTVVSELATKELDSFQFYKIGGKDWERQWYIVHDKRANTGLHMGDMDASVL